MAIILSFVAENVALLSQNNRNLARLTRMRDNLTIWHNNKYQNNPLPFNHKLDQFLRARVFYIHRIADYKDADNISKPMWDAFNNHAYIDDRQVKHIETLKISVYTPDILQIDITDIDIDDLQRLINFIYDIGQNRDSVVYIELSDYETKNVKFR